MSSSVTDKSLVVLVLGASGMLGNAVFRTFCENESWAVWGSVRSPSALHQFPEHLRCRLIVGCDVSDTDGLVKLVAQVKPNILVNCIGLVKQLADANDPLQALPVNAILPHRLAQICRLGRARLIHISTDCVFSGSRGNYAENDLPDATDLYGRSKLLGEVDYDNAITLRTSIIGTELIASHSLVGWFLAQQGSVRGFTRAIFSGLPTVELARVIRDHVIPRPDLRGLYHVASSPISKFHFLEMVARAYDRTVTIEQDPSLIIDRSLNAGRFFEATGYSAPEWPDLVRSMREFG